MSELTHPVTSSLGEIACRQGVLRARGICNRASLPHSFFVRLVTVVKIRFSNEVHSNHFQGCYRCLLPASLHAVHQSRSNPDMAASVLSSDSNNSVSVILDRLSNTVSAFLEDDPWDHTKKESVMEKMQIMRRLNNASVLKRMIGLTLLKVSMACVAAQRVVDGVDIRFARTPCPIPELLKALLLSWILMSLRLLANHLVHRSETDRPE